MPEVKKILYHTSLVPALAYWRVLWPAYQMGLRGEAVSSVLKNFVIDVYPYTRSDVVVLQRLGGKDTYDYMAKLAELRETSDFKMIYDVDDVLFGDHVPEYHYGKAGDEQFDDVGTKALMSLCDEMTVSTQYLKDYYLEHTDQKNITVLPNRIPYFWAGNVYSESMLRRNYNKHKKKPRIIYAGSSSHIDCAEINDGKDDFSAVLKIIEETRHEFTWVFLATCPFALMKYVEAKEMEYYKWVPLGLLPKAIHSLEGNMMIAPLVSNIYNHAKSNIKFLESAAQGLPIACQDITPYKEAPIRFNTGEEMLEKIRYTLKSEEIYINESLKGREIVDRNWLEINSNIEAYRDVYTYPYGDPRRVN